MSHFGTKIGLSVQLLLHKLSHYQAKLDASTLSSFTNKQQSLFTTTVSFGDKSTHVDKP